jgi:hypothetical protein
VTKRKPDTPLRFEVAPGIVAAHDGHTVVILDAPSSLQVRVRDVATGAEQTVSISELSGIAGGLTRGISDCCWIAAKASLGAQLG